MKILRTFPSLVNNWSFGIQVRRDRTINDLIADKTVIENEKIFAGCSGYTRVALSNSKFIFQVPVSYFAPKFNTPEFFKKWEEEMALMGGNAKYLGDYPYLGTALGVDPVLTYNRTALSNAYNLVNYPLEFFIKENVWSTWELDAAEYCDKIATYHSFCLFRYLWSWHYHKLVDVYFDIKARLTKTKPEPIEMFQLACYSYDLTEAETKTSSNDGRPTGFSPAYGHMAIGSHARQIFKWEELKPKIKDTTNHINSVFTNLHVVESTSTEEIRTLINQRKYKAAYDKLKKA